MPMPMASRQAVQATIAAQCRGRARAGTPVQGVLTCLVPVSGRAQSLLPSEGLTSLNYCIFCPCIS